MYAVIESGGKQYSVGVGDIIYVEKLNVADGSKFDFEKVLMISNDNGVVLGKPFVDGASVSADVVKTDKRKKIRVFKYKPKKNYKRTYGHRQFYTKLKIESINFKN